MPDLCILKDFRDPEQPFVLGKSQKATFLEIYAGVVFTKPRGGDDKRNPYFCPGCILYEARLVM